MLVLPKYYCKEYKSNRSYRAKMIIVLLTAVLIADGCSAQTTEEYCDPYKLSQCVHLSIRTQLELPRTKEELDEQCLAYHTDTSCMDTWVKRCLAKHHPDKHKLVQEQAGGARALVRYLCSNDTALRRDFLKEVSCWSMVSPDWSRCVDKLQRATVHISKYDHNMTAKMCCAHDGFVSCVGHAGRACSSVAGAQLQRLSWVLAEDVAECIPDVEQPREPCPISRAPHLSALLPLMYLLYILHLETKY